jgi:hypothetical protein
MVFVKNDMKKEFVMPLKDNRKVALSVADKKQGRYVRVNTLIPAHDTVMRIYLEGVEFPLLLARQIFINEDSSTAILYLVSSDMTLDYQKTTILYQKRWKVEEYHKSLKQNASLCKSPTHTVVTQTNHFFASLYAFVKLEVLTMNTSLKHFALKSKIYLSALKTAFVELQKLKAITITA